MNTTSPNVHAFESGSSTSSEPGRPTSTPSLSWLSACALTPTEEAWSRMFSEVNKPLTASAIFVGSVRSETRGRSNCTVNVCDSRASFSSSSSSSCFSSSSPFVLSESSSSLEEDFEEELLFSTRQSDTTSESGTAMGGSASAAYL